MRSARSCLENSPSSGDENGSRAQAIDLFKVPKLGYFFASAMKFRRPYADCRTIVPSLEGSLRDWRFLRSKDALQLLWRFTVHPRKARYLENLHTVQGVLPELVAIETRQGLIGNQATRVRWCCPGSR